MGPESDLCSFLAQNKYPTPKPSSRSLQHKVPESYQGLAFRAEGLAFRAEGLGLQV